MRILSIYPNADGYGRIPTGLAIIMTVLKNAGHEVGLFDTTFLHSANKDNDTRLRAGLVKAVESQVGVKDDAVVIGKDGSLDLSFDSFTKNEIEVLFLKKLKSFKPELVIASIVEDNYVWADRLFRIVKKWKKNTNIVVGGPTPSAAPKVMIENPHIDFLVQGEGENAICELCEELNGNGDFASVKNLWYKQDGIIYNNELMPFLNMDTIPIQDVELWDRRHFNKPYDGKMYWTGYFEMSRGCPYSCTYCVNHTIRKSLKSAGRYFRRKSSKIGIEEINHHVVKYNLKRIVFCDDNFLMMPKNTFKSWADEFKTNWLQHINLPYWITTSADFINHDTLQLLVDTGCDGIGLGVESGGEWFKKHILKRPMKNDRIKAVFDLIHDYGIRTTANIMMGFPGEYEFDVFESIKLMREINPDSFDISLVAPYIGTDIHAVAIELGLIDSMDAPGFKGMCQNISFRQHSNIRNPNISDERLSELYDMFTGYVKGDLTIPEKFIQEAPGATQNSILRGLLSKDVADIIKTRQ